jgi:hypothetical protein
MERILKGAASAARGQLAEQIAVHQVFELFLAAADVLWRQCMSFSVLRQRFE